MIAKNQLIIIFNIFFFIFLLSGLVLFNGCKQKSQRYELTGNDILDAQNLIRINCTRCHALVPVNALNKDVWKYHTLPSMAPYLGVSAYMGGYYKNEKDTGGLSVPEWQLIVSYYEKMAPDTLLTAKKPIPLINDWAGFKLKTPPPVNNVCFTTLATIAPASGLIYTSDLKLQKLTSWTEDFKPTDIATLPSAAVNAYFRKSLTGNNEALLSDIGRINPVDFANGKITSVYLDASAKGTNAIAVAGDLERPVQTLEQDFNKDGLKDLVVLAQGHLKGGVYLFQQNNDQTYLQKTITEQPGAVQAVTGDFNNDGWADLMVLFGSGDEGLWLFLNDKKGGFTSRNLLRFPPVYGSTSFQLADMNHDGKLDLIYTCGYNFHDSRILKPYHGLYIFKNTGDWNFQKEWFYPINGCTKAIAADFDGDGDLDIATTAFFADLKDEPAEEFIYFEHVTPMVFKPHSPPVSKYGRWFSIDVGDYNHDGKPDIVLGNYSTGFLFQPGLKPFWDKNTPFIILENNLVNKK